MLPNAMASATTLADPVRTIEISGEGLEAPVKITSDKDKQRFTAIMTELALLPTQPGVLASPPSERLGAKYTIVIYTDGKPTDTYDLYPQAAGGPRVFRPAAQPDQHPVSEGWFLGRLSLPTTLINVGVPLTGVVADPGVGVGRGGGGAEPVPTASELPDLAHVLGDWTKFTGLNSVLIVIVAMGIFVLAFVLRKQGR